MTERITSYIPERHIDILEAGQKPRKQHDAAVLEKDIVFNTDGLRSYALAKWEAVVFDALLVAAAVEFADRTVRRSSLGWQRRLTLRIPVHQPERWSNPAVSQTLKAALNFVTGDSWNLEFVARKKKEPQPAQEFLDLSIPAEAVIAYSDGMDSRAVAGILGEQMGERLLRLHIGTRSRKPYHEGRRQPFTRVPYQVKAGRRAKEPTVRSRGFKYALISGIAAYLADADQVAMSESGQGALGPALVTLAHAYPDYRNHPLFTKRMEAFFKALLGEAPHYLFPRLWSTKAETLREYAALAHGNDWARTKSCWQDSRRCTVDHRLRPCGICAACLLRRMSVHAAGLEEAPETYVTTNINAPTLGLAVDTAYDKPLKPFEEYAIAGVLNLDHLADMAGAEADGRRRREACLLSIALGEPLEDVNAKLSTLLSRHAAEWNGYLESLNQDSFISQWVRSRT